MLNLKTFITTILFGLILFTCNSFAQSKEQAYIDSGKANVAKKQYLDAIVDFNNAIKLDPNNEEAYSSRAVCYMAYGKWEKAIPDCDKAIALNPKQAIAYFVRGSAKINLDKDGCEDLHISKKLGYKMADKAIKKYCK